MLPLPGKGYVCRNLTNGDRVSRGAIKDEEEPRERKGPAARPGPGAVDRAVQVTLDVHSDGAEIVHIGGQKRPISVDGNQPLERDWHGRSGDGARSEPGAHRAF